MIPINFTGFSQDLGPDQCAAMAHNFGQIVLSYDAVGKVDLMMMATLLLCVGVVIWMAWKVQQLTKEKEEK